MTNARITKFAVKSLIVQCGLLSAAILAFMDTLRVILRDMEEE